MTLAELLIACLLVALVGVIAWWGTGRLDDFEKELGGHWLNGDERR